MLRAAVSRVGILVLRLREGACNFQEGTHFITEGSVNDVKPDFHNSNAF